MSPARFLLALKARWRTALAVLTGVVGLTALVSLLLPAEYTATATVMVDARQADPLTTATPQPPAPAYITAQVDLIQSERVARAVMAATGLGARADDELHRLWRSQTDGEGDFGAWLAARMRKKLDVRPTKESGTISISYTARDRDQAARIANAYVQAYTDTALALRLEPARSTGTFFDERARQLRAALEDAQGRLSAFQREHGLLALGSDDRLDIETARLNELSSQLVALQAQAGESGSRQSQARSQPERTPEVIAHPAVAALSGDLMRQEARLSEMGTRLGDRHPAIIEQRATVAQLRSQLAAETRRVAASLGVGDTVNQQRVAQVRASLEAQRARVLEMSTRRDEARVLQRDVQNAQAAYDAAAGRMTQSATESQARLSHVAVLRQATPPAEPSSPRLGVNLGVAALLGTLLALAVTLAAELRNRRLHCADDVPELLDLPLLVEIPAQGARRTLRQRLLPGADAQPPRLSA
ncbi:MAG: chain length determinant protein EpsF [Pseudomonadota bacterium]|jgi:chain length determinant protein EpsF